jgi:hypothetical protein
MIQAFSLIFKIFNIASPCSDMLRVNEFPTKGRFTLQKVNTFTIVGESCSFIIQNFFFKLHVNKFL